MGATTAHSTHDQHDEHDEQDQSGGHAADPNAGVVRGEPPTPAWIAAAAVIALVTTLAVVWLAVAIG